MRSAARCSTASRTITTLTGYFKDGQESFHPFGRTVAVRLNESAFPLNSKPREPKRAPVASHFTNVWILDQVEDDWFGRAQTYLLGFRHTGRKVPVDWLDVPSGVVGRAQSRTLSKW